MKEGLEEKAKDFEYLFKEDEEKIKSKIEELERFLGTSHKPRPEPVQRAERVAEVRGSIEEALEQPVSREVPSDISRLEDTATPSEEMGPEASSERAYEPSARPRSAEDVLEDNKANEDAMVRKFIEDRALKPADENFSKGNPMMKEVPKSMQAEAPKAAAEEDDFRSKEMALMEAAGKKGSVDKDQDDLLKLMQKDKRVNLKTASKILNVPDETITVWANDLKERGILNIHPKFMGGTELELTKDAMRRLKELEEEDKVSKIKKELERIREEQRKMKGG